MSFEINTGTLIIGALIFFMAVFVKPFIMILRDIVVWWWIKKYLLNEKYRFDLASYKHLSKTLFHRLNIDGIFKFDSEKNDYVYKKDKVEIRLDEDELELIKNDTKRKSDWYVKKKIEFTKSSDLYDTVTRHYGQNKTNPIDEDLKGLRDEEIRDEHVGVILIISEYFTDKVRDYIRIPQDHG